MTLSATDQFWYSPIIQVIPSTSDTSTSDDHDESMEMSLPPAHNQLLSQDHVSSENLKGYDHTQDVIGHDNLGGYGSDESSFCCRQKLLLGFDHFNDKTVTSQQPQAEVDVMPPGLVRVLSDEYSSSEDDNSASGESLSPLLSKSNRSHIPPRSVLSNDVKCTRSRPKSVRIRLATRRNTDMTDMIGGILRRSGIWAWIWLRGSWSILCMNNGEVRFRFGREDDPTHIPCNTMMQGSGQTQPISYSNHHKPSPH
mmetsp:Transcript_32451/g.59970  ORF Transcript_32451/g.59970 Transcript_32451/m.59970 type:complete len:254 (+) Transcript_32451:234-995(+)